MKKSIVLALFLFPLGNPMAQEVTIPELDTTEKSIGRDANCDGIRDDVPAHIYKIGLDDYKTLILMNYHKSIYTSLSSGKYTTKQTRLEASKRLSEAKACIKKELVYAQENIKYVEDLTLNTKGRRALFEDRIYQFPIDEAAKCPELSFTEDDLPPVKVPLVKKLPKCDYSSEPKFLKK